MIDKILNIPLGEIKKGFIFDDEAHKYTCNICGREFEKGEIFLQEGRYFEAERMVSIHIKKEHSQMLDVLISNDKKYTGITDNQRELIKMISSGMSDNEIAKATGAKPATIRHQRFVFREKAKQAKLFLAIYELMTEGAALGNRQSAQKDEIIDIHKGATMVDDRYLVTKAEEEQIISSMFYSESPLRLKSFSPKEKKKIVILKKISEQFERDKRYTEKEVNNILKEIYEDYATLRRYLIEYGFMERTTDCKEYWLK